MPATYVTIAELRTNLGIGTLYADSVVEEVCQAADASVPPADMRANLFPLVLSTMWNLSVGVVVCSGCAERS